ncbi:DUF4145 domain-containing protein [Shimazuella alba]|uniref:DUF4145 domain-containing protein n=1 Tax=Shimazuella alba TaxID=2690964 RepID=A0A6I4W3D6_9BACL|nr:DUF4145 domain-containing protein [Shimazuella alba]MXQ55294.1 DUF4145 domain-containing protein [Shimazuella alba]
MNSNFDKLTGKWQSLGKLGQEAEQYVTSDPSVALFKLRLFAEKMTEEILRLEGINTFEFDNQVDKLNKLEEEQLLSAEILMVFHHIRKAGNKAAHTGEGTTEETHMLLDQASYLGSWFIERYVENNRVFGKFIQDAEQYVTSDPSVALFKLRIFAEKMIEEILRLEGIIVLETNHQIDKLSKLEEKQLLPAEILMVFHHIRKAGNRAAHTGEGTTEEASILLEQASRLCSWFAEYVTNNDGKERKSLGKILRYISVGKNNLSFVPILPLVAIIPFEAFIWSIYGVGFAFGVAMTLFIIYIWRRARLNRSGHRKIGYTFWIGVFLIGSLGLLIEEDVIKTTSYKDIDFTLFPQDDVTTGSETMKNFNVYDSFYDDSTLYIDNKIIDTTNISWNIDVGSKIYAEWTFPWGGMKSDTQHVETEYMQLYPKADPQLQKQLTNFLNEFAKQCVQAKLKNNPNIVTLVSGDIDDMCKNASFFDDNEKLIETGIDFKNSKPEFYSSFLFNDYVLVFKLSAYIKYDTDGETETLDGSLRLIYNKTKKNWSVEHWSTDLLDQGEYENNPDVVITKFE